MLRSPTSLAFAPNEAIMKRDPNGMLLELVERSPR